MIDLTKADRSFLLYLALHGPSIGNRMKPEVKNAARTAKRLKREGMIEGKYSDEYSRAAEPFSLTLPGFLKVLPFTRPEEWQAVIERWSELAPPVFGKWDVFVSAGVEDLAMWRLKMASLSRFSEIPFVTDLLPSEITMSEPMVLEFFCMNFYRPEVGRYGVEGQDRWIEACRNDEEIPKWLIQILKRSLIHHSTELINIKKMLATLQDKGKGKTIPAADLEEDDLFIFAIVE